MKTEIKIRSICETLFGFLLIDSETYREDLHTCVGVMKDKM